MSLSKPTKDYLANEIRIVLVGKVGVGKSATGNTILGEKKFKSIPASKAVTKFSEHASLERFGRYIHVVDVPGFRDTSCSKEELHKQIMQCVALVSPGIHAILFVVRIGRYTEEDVKTVEDFIQIFGPKSRDFVIVVFTGEDDLEDDYDLQTFVQDAEVSLKTFLREVNQRFIAVNNKSSAAEKTRFVKDLLQKIEQLLRDNSNTFYTCDMVDNVEEQMKILEDKRANEKEEKNKERNESIIEESLQEYKDQLAKEKISQEEESKRIEEKKGEINIKIDSNNHLESHYEVRDEMSETLKQMDAKTIAALLKEQSLANAALLKEQSLANAALLKEQASAKANTSAGSPKEEQKSNAGLCVAVGAAATAGAAYGTAVASPIGTAIGGLAGETYGALLNLWG